MAYLLRDGVGLGEGTCLVGEVNLYDTYNLGRVYLDVRCAYAVAGSIYGNLAS
jgi:hypothetical protein